MCVLFCCVLFHWIVLRVVSHRDRKVYLTPGNTGTGRYIWSQCCLTHRQGVIWGPVHTGMQCRYWLCNWPPLLLPPWKSVVKSTLLTNVWQSTFFAGYKELWCPVPGLCSYQSGFLTLAFAERWTASSITICPAPNTILSISSKSMSTFISDTSNKNAKEVIITGFQNSREDGRDF